MLNRFEGRVGLLPVSHPFPRWFLLFGQTLLSDSGESKMASPSTNTPRGILINRNTDSHHNAEDAHQREVIRYPFSDTEESTEDIRSPNEGPSSLGSQYSSRLRPTEDADDSEGVPDEVLDEAARSLKNEIVIMSGYLLKKGEKRRVSIFCTGWEEGYILSMLSTSHAQRHFPIDLEETLVCPTSDSSRVLPE